MGKLFALNRIVPDTIRLSQLEQTPAPWLF
jgi:hypothetical protein